MMDWQPIETAPKGERILALCGESVEIVEWFNGWGSGVVTKESTGSWGISVFQGHEYRKVYDEGWDTGTGAYLEPYSPPIKWMLLPAL